MTHVEWHKWPEGKPAKGSDRNKFLLTFKTEKGSYYTSIGKWYWDTCDYSIDPSIGNIRFRPWSED